VGVLNSSPSTTHAAPRATGHRRGAPFAKMISALRSGNTDDSIAFIIGSKRQRPAWTPSPLMITRRGLITVMSAASPRPSNDQLATELGG